MLTRRSLLLGFGSAAVALTGCQSPLPNSWAAAVGLGSPLTDPQPGATMDLAAHLLARCTSAPRRGDRAALLALASDPDAAVEAWIDQQLDLGGVRDRTLDRLLADLDTIHAPSGELYEYKRQVVRDELAWAALARQAAAKAQLAEQVAAVWRDHLHVGPRGDAAWLAAAYEREVIRPQVFGSFRQMLQASLYHPAMLHYLDNATNRREHPNENYARELLELHTLGVGSGYTQRDVMEVARCLSGLVVRSSSQFRKAAVSFDRERHDDGAKTVLGQAIPAGQGEGDIDAVLDLLCRQRATAERLAGKLARRFIADDPPSAVIAAGADAFERSAGDLGETVRAILRHGSFRDPAIRGEKLRRPHRWLAGCLRLLLPESPFARPPQALLLTCANRLGDLPWQHLTPDGPPEAARHWSGTLWWRWRAAHDLAHAMPTAVEPALAWGRQPTADERKLLDQADGADRTALILTAPGFLRC